MLLVALWIVEIILIILFFSEKILNMAVAWLKIKHLINCDQIFKLSNIGIGLNTPVQVVLSLSGVQAVIVEQL